MRISILTKQVCLAITSSNGALSLACNYECLREDPFKEQEAKQNP